MYNASCQMQANHALYGSSALNNELFCLFEEKLLRAEEEL